ncbi:gamma-glutamyl-gamma-aminobutyrate hydrolase [Sphaerisporangium krabiense]|uniref:Putative glutamine amidotransferase n=1 Tax=Sphaerisporangium krabiense TaxID=763782 RepID=A0A7W9DT02_9ACTN|nr:gamma-glutamyl-gamma-aminobutyrate hydrolase family protein [Sphaerisporangium krabiense]MBB5629664.1 putative glutamine amidotransferase [Sphaerisporangium krabiense]GII63762.1 gamma-glutamyl-gamma-aminobutyrate hydrolase [Sphaerisporangium krabiense]
MPRRPIIAIPSRFAAQTSALRYAAVVTARALADAVLRAGAEPFLVHPGDAAEAASRLWLADGVLLPGGGDLAPATYGEGVAHDTVYDVDDAQDAFDLAVARHALETGLPLLAICRGLQVVNVALGGRLRQHMESAHRHLVHPVAVRPGSLLAEVTGAGKVEASCFHHQCVSVPGAGLVATAHAADGTAEAYELADPRGWFLGVQWHPEDTAGEDPANQRLFDALTHAAARR